MFKKILMTAAALSAMMFGASAANATYGYGYNHGYSYGYSYRPAYSHSYSYSHYQPSCYYKSVPVTIRPTSSSSPRPAIPAWATLSMPLRWAKPCSSTASVPTPL